MQKALHKQKGDIDLVMELNQTLNNNKQLLEEKNAKLQIEVRKAKEAAQAEIEKEKNHRQQILESLNETD